MGAILTLLRRWNIVGDGKEGGRERGKADEGLMLGIPHLDNNEEKDAVWT